MKLISAGRLAKGLFHARGDSAFTNFRRSAAALSIIIATLGARSTSQGAETFYSAYGANRTNSVIAAAGTNTCEIDGIASSKTTKWYVNDVYQAGQDDSSGLFAVDPDFTFSFSAGTTKITGIVQGSPTQTHIWNVTVDTGAPSKPVLSSPSNGSNASTSSVTFTWGAATDSGSGIKEYRLQVSTSSTFSSFVVNKTLTGTTSTETLSTETTYYWRVIDYDNAKPSSNSTTSDTWTVVRQTPRVTGLSWRDASGNALTTIEAGQTVYVRVDATGMANQTVSVGVYEYDSVSANDFVENVSVTIGSSGFGTAPWVAKWVDDGLPLDKDDEMILTYSGVSNSAQLTVRDTTGPSAPVLSSPADNATVASSPVSFSWSASTDATRASGLRDYTLQVSTSSSFSSFVINHSGLTSTTSSEALPGDGIYFWRVIAYDRIGNATNSSPVSRTLTAQTPEVVTAPSTPSGASTGEVGVELNFTAGGAQSNKDHPLEYQFDWGDGTKSAWLSTATALHLWPTAGNYNVTAQARCATHVDVISTVSSSRNVAILEGTAVLTAVVYDLDGRPMITVPQPTVRLYSVSANGAKSDLNQTLTCSNGTASWTALHAGDYYVEAYRGSELWSSGTSHLTRGATVTLPLRRTAPRAEMFAVFQGGADVTGGPVSSGTALRLDVRVRNDSGTAQTVRMRFRVDQNKAAGWDYESSPTTNQTIDSGKTVTFSFSYAPTANGVYYRSFEVETLTNGIFTQTDAWAWERAFSVAAAREYGVTIITHGYVLGASSPANGWVQDMGVSVLNRASRGKIYRFDAYTDELADITSLMRSPGSGRIALSDSVATDAAGEQVILVDWVHTANNTFANPAGQAEAVGQAIFALLSGRPTKENPFIGTAAHRRPLHFIAHSFGTVVISEAIQRLGGANIDVEQMTLLDPHDWDESFVPVDGAALLPDVHVWKNVARADCYFTTLGGGLADNPHGRDVAGAVNYDLTSLEGFANGLVNYPHSRVHTFYQGTITPSLIGSDVDDLLVNPVWYDSPLRRGYAYSRLGGRNSLSDFDAPNAARSGGDSLSSPPPNSTRTNANGQADLGIDPPKPFFNGDFDQYAYSDAGYVAAQVAATGLFTENRAAYVGGFYDELDSHLTFVPVNATALRFKMSLDPFGVVLPSDSLRVTFYDGSDSRNVVLGEVSLPAYESRGFVTFRADLANCAGRSGTFSFEILRGLFSSAAVYIDDIEILLGTVPDTAPPNAALAAPNVTSSGTASLTFTVSFADESAIDVTTLGSANVRVTGPSGYNQLATFLSVDSSTNGTPRVATYRISAPGGTWDMTDNGVYNVAIEPNQVADTSGNRVLPGSLGSFNVAISDQTAPLVAITSPGDGNTFTTAAFIGITASATDNTGVARVEFYDGATLVASDTTAPYGCLWTFTAANNGTHVWTAKAYDAAGNSAVSSSVALTIAISTLPPATAIDPLLRDIPSAGATNQAITVNSNTTWTAESKVSWVVITAGKSGDGSGSVTYTVAANTSPLARTGTITIGGQTHIVNQAGRDQPPRITADPLDQIVNVGEAASFAVLAEGTAPLVYMWRRNGEPISGATMSGYSMVSAQSADSGTYDVVVTNGAGTVTSGIAKLIVIPTGTEASHQLTGATGYVAGRTVMISGQVSFNGTAAGLNWRTTLPQGWTLVSTDAVSAVGRPSAGQTGTLEWTWGAIGQSPIHFNYILRTPDDQVGSVELAATVSLQQNNATFPISVRPATLIIDQALHSADTNLNSQISLLELTRVIELYNTKNGTNRTGAYKVQEGTEDGFAADPARSAGQGGTLIRYHTADTGIASTPVAPNGAIDLTELTRVIALYNYRVVNVRTGDYHPHPGSEDGFNPGPASVHPAQ